MVLHGSLASSVPAHACAQRFVSAPRSLNTVTSVALRRQLVTAAAKSTPGKGSAKKRGKRARSAQAAPPLPVFNGKAAVLPGVPQEAQQGYDDEGWASDEDADPFATAYEDSEEARAFDRIMNPVVKVYCRHTEPHFSLPWQRQRQFSSSSSGFAVLWGKGAGRQRWLLTNAHSVEYHSQVRVKKRGDETKYLAKVLAVGTECDVALLTVEDDAFWEGVQPIRLGPMPMLQESVAVVGYPVGGDTTSVTAGVVSRIEVTSYVHGSSQLLGVQIDAAINSGNSGGPVFNGEGALVGIAFQSFAGSDAENIGWVIPTAVLHHFLEDYQRNESFTGFPCVGLVWQKMESKALKRQMKMQDHHRGVLITHVIKTSESAKVLRQGDVLMRFDGQSIACDGTVEFRTGERMHFRYLVSQRFVGDEVPVTVLRDGKPLDLDIILSAPNFLVPPHLSAADPAYLVVSGLVFTVASEPYLESEYGMDYTSMAPVKLLEKVFHGRMDHPDEQLVVLSQVLACDATMGYEDIQNIQVRSFNGTPIKNLLQLACLITDCTSEFFVFGLEYEEVLVLDAAEARASTAEILQVHNIPQQISAELKAALDARGTPPLVNPDAVVPAPVEEVLLEVPDKKKGAGKGRTKDRHETEAS